MRLPSRAAEAYLRLPALPAQEARVDWGHFGRIVIGGANRQLMAFVLVLTRSRMVYLRFLAHPPLSNKRLSCTPDGRAVYE